MDAIEALTSRKSVAMLEEPAPSSQELETLFAAAVRAPDHCRLRPWRFIVMDGDGRARLGDIFAEALKQREPEATEAMQEKARGKPLRAPMVIVVIAKTQEHPKVPKVEQILSAGAAAQNIMLAAHAMGYAGIWRSGSPCFDPNVKAALGAEEEDQIVGFLYLGTAGRTMPIPQEPVSEYVEHWSDR